MTKQNYTLTLVCTNCGCETIVTLPYGTPFNGSEKCSNCGCASLKKPWVIPKQPTKEPHKKDVIDPPWKIKDNIPPWKHPYGYPRTCYPLRLWNGNNDIRSCIFGTVVT